MKGILTLVMAVALAIPAPARAVTMEEEVRAVFGKFVAAQNARDLKTMKDLLVDSPDFLLITRGRPIWGREDMLKNLEGRYKGTWHLDPDKSELRVISVSRRVAQVYAPTQLTVGEPGAEPAKIRTYINLVMVKKAEGWRITSVLPILVTPQ